MITRSNEGPRVEPGSFRDRDGQVFYHDGVVLRGLSQQALADWELLSSKPFFQRLLAERKLIDTQRVDLAERIDTSELGSWAAFLRHERIPFVSYPYEWSFGMLKDAALLHLELLMAALEDDVTLKDASAFNVQWQGAKPVFIDIPSFQKLRPGEPWGGYRQFCQMFLYPLFLQAYKDVAFHPWLRGSIDGIDAGDCDRLMSVRDRLRPGVLAHVYLQAKAQAAYAATPKDVKRELRTVGFGKELIRANARGLTKLIAGLTWKRTKSAWSEYANDNSYTSEDRALKEKFVGDAVSTRRRQLVWDLGCNTGTFSRIASENASYVVAMDADHLAIERLYQALKAEGNRSILPLVNNLADPSPSLGWRLLERKSLAERGRPGLVLCLALIHHIVLSANVPLREFATWLAELGADLVIEFVTRDDPMVKRILRNKVDNYTDYDLHYFEHCLSQHFEVVKRQALSSGTRIMYFAENKAQA